MSLAMTAALVEDYNTHEIINNQYNLINQKKHNKTQKNISDNQFNSEKVNNVIKSLYSQDNQNIQGNDTQQKELFSNRTKPLPFIANENNGYTGMSDFKPLPNATSAAIERKDTQTKKTDNNTINPLIYSTSDTFNTNRNTLKILENKNENFTNLTNDININQNISNIPNISNSIYDDGTKEINNVFMNSNEAEKYYHKYNLDKRNCNNQFHTNTTNTNIDVLINKLNYMIHLLEEQQDVQTNNITEEIILYSFLGIFVIFIVDSFTRVGKYIR